jgi:hypothetical protein
MDDLKQECRDALELALTNARSAKASSDQAHLQVEYALRMFRLLDGGLSARALPAKCKECPHWSGTECGRWSALAVSGAVVNGPPPLACPLLMNYVRLLEDYVENLVDMLPHTDTWDEGREPVDREDTAARSWARLMRWRRTYLPGNADFLSRITKAAE